MSAYPACRPDVESAGARSAEIPIEGAVTDGLMVTAPAWPAHPAWMRQFLQVLAERHDASTCQVCNIEQRACTHWPYRRQMGLNRIKIGLAAAWLLAIIVIGFALKTTSGGGLFMLACFGIIPPIAMWKLWTEPTQTMSESIQSGRR